MKTNLSRQHNRRAGSRNTFGDFVCMVCHNFVSAEPGLSGVRNRNHCPYCLSSRHLDLFRAGDRLSACKSAMRPAALTLKKTAKKYATAGQGELMLVHVCDECGKPSINRIAADDDLLRVFEIFERSRELDEDTKSRLAQSGIDLLETGHFLFLREQLLGRT
ncbi:MAG: RNHCP domain-containing protein [Anaerolineales bacterium]